MSYRNSFGYRDPTAALAIGNACREEKRQRKQAESLKLRSVPPAQAGAAPTKPRSESRRGTAAACPGNPPKPPSLVMVRFEQIRQTDELVRKLRKKLEIAPWSEFSDPQEPASEMVHMLARAENRSAILRTRMILSICRMKFTHDRLILFCLHLENWSWEKVSEMLSWKISTVRLLYQHALVELEKILKEEQDKEEQSHDE